MSTLNFNAQEVEPNAGNSPAPPGKYKVILTSSELKPTKKGDGEIIALKAQIQGGESHGKTVPFNINWKNPNKTAEEIGHGQLSAICHATNVIHLQDTQQLHGIPFMLEVDVTPDGKYNDVKGFYPIAMEQAPQQQAPQQQAPQQQAPQQAPQEQTQESPPVPDWIKRQREISNG